ncbi:SWIM zinc finger family protein [Salinactinospora qingdaonensis]
MAKLTAMVSKEFSIEDLRAVANPTWLERGEKYVTDGQVGRLRSEAGQVTAVVGGERDYLVRLRWPSGSPTGVCGCPQGTEGEPWCEHAIAVALAWLEESSDNEHGDAAGEAPRQDEAALTAFLTAQEPAWLTEQLMNAAEDDPVLWGRMAAAAGLDAAVSLCRDLLREAVLAYVPEAEFRDSRIDDGAERLRRAVALLDDLLDYGFTEQVAEVADEILDTYDETHDDYESEHSERLAEIAESAHALLQR